MVPGSSRTFGTEENSFRCCTGTGAEGYSKLGDSIYFAAGDDSLYVNLFIPSELNWTERGIRIKQTNDFPLKPETQLEIEGKIPQKFVLNIRIPAWVQGVASVAINSQQSDVSAAGGSYLVLNRTWTPGDVVHLTLPMSVLPRAHAGRLQLAGIPLRSARAGGTREHLGSAGQPCCRSYGTRFQEASAC